MDGIFAIAAAVRRFGQGRPGGWLLFEGLVGVIAGIVAFFFTSIASLALLFLIAAWAIITGIMEIVQAVELRRVLTNEWLLILGGAAAVIFGVLILFFPGAGLVAVTWLIGIYAIIYGVLLLGLAWRLRGFKRAAERAGAMGHPA